MTRYILIGGGQKKFNKAELGKAIFDGSASTLKFLICLFARNQNIWDWQELFDQNIEFFKAIAPNNVRIQFDLATEIDFEKQVEESDIIYFSGGDSIPLYSALARVGNGWTKYIDKKTIIGTSASTDMLSEYNFDIQENCLDKGLGLVP
jgi:cyanophycinase-like exopeptidase